jgi:hypothetical protein
MTHFYFDTEFIEDGKTIDLISIGMLSSTGSKLHLVNRECDTTKADYWVRTNVLPHIPPPEITPHLTRKEIAASVLHFVEKHPKPWEFWAYYADYDWVVLCQLFGRMVDLPRGFPMYCRDLKQEMDRLGIAKEQLPPQEGREHDALSDAQ